MPPNSRVLTGVEMQVNGQKVLAGPKKINIIAPGASGQENPAETAEITLPEGVPAPNGFFGKSAPAFATPYNISSYVSHSVGGYAEAGTGTSYPKDILMAYPDYEIAGHILRGLKLRKNTAGNKLVASIGIYANTVLNGNYFPGSLLAEIVFTNTTDVRPIITNASFGATTIISSDLPFTFLSSALYWYAFVLSDTSGGIAPITLIGTLVGSTSIGRHYLGWQHHSSTNLGPIVGVEHSFVYAGLPDPFPTSAPALIYPGGTRTSVPCLSKIYQALS